MPIIFFESPAEVFFQKDQSNKQIIGDDDLRPLEVLANLRWFEIEQNSNVTDAGLKHLAKAANLRLLRLRTKPLTNAALAELGSLSRLEHLELYSVAMSGEGFSQLERLANLEDIGIYGSIEHPSIAMQHLKQLPKLKSIQFNLHNYPEWTDLAMDDGVGFSKLTGLFLQGKISDRAYEQLQRFPCLEWLSLWPADSPDDNMLQVAQMPKLRELFIYSDGITDRGIEALSDANGLKQLTVYSADHLTNSSIEALVDLPQLESLDIRDAPFNDDALKLIARMTAINHVHIINAHFSDAAIKNFRGEHPTWTIGLSLRQ